MLPFSGTANLAEKPDMVSEKYLLQNWKRTELGAKQSDSQTLPTSAPVTENIPPEFLTAYPTFSLGF